MNKQFSMRLARAIEALGISPTQFAHKAGIPQGTISKCLSGHVPTARILLRISRVSGKSVDWLLTGKERRKAREGYVAERAARYGSAKEAGKTKAERVWVAKLLKVLRGSSGRKKQTIKDLLDVLSR
jgi:predicted transcriptional regulator